MVETGLDFVCSVLDNRYIQYTSHYHTNTDFRQLSTALLPGTDCGQWLLFFQVVV